MSDSRFTYDLRDVQFVLFEQLGIERLFQFPAHSGFDRGDIEAILGEGVKFAQEVLAACNESGDREGCRWESGRVTAPPSFRAAYNQQRDARWMTMSTPVEYGGQGLPYCVGASLGEAFVGANSSLAMTAGLTRAAADLLIQFGSDEMKQRYLPRMIDGHWGGTMCLTEAHAGSAVGMVTTRASQRDGQYWLKGNKIFISGGEHDLVDNIIHLVLARVEGASAGTKGLSLFLVPKIRVNADGSLGEPNDVVCTGIEHKLGIHGSPTCALAFGENDRCQAFLIGQEEQGMEIMFHMMNEARVGVGIQGVALGSAAYQAALAYARTRLQGPDMKNFRDATAPQVTINQHPDVKRMLATMKAYVEGGRALILHTAHCLDLAEHSPDEAEREKLSGRVELLTPLCKAWCTDTGFEVTELALQTLGGHGYLKDYPIEQYLRDVKIASIYEGTNGIQAIDLLGRKVGRKGGLLFMTLMSDIGQFLESHASHPLLGPSVELLQARKQKVEAITMQFGMSQMQGDLYFPLFEATPYLRMLSNVVVGWLLMEQGVIAAAALERLWKQHGATSDEARAALAAEPGEVQFYDHKVRTARFFVSHLLAENEGLAAAIESGDRSALEMSF